MKSTTHPTRNEPDHDVRERDERFVAAKKVLDDMHAHGWYATDQLAAYIHHLSREGS